MVQQSLVLGGAFGVAPEFGRAQNLALCVEQHQPVLLAGNTEAEDGLAVDLRSVQGLAGGLDESLQPLPGVLLAAAVGAADQLMGSGALTQHLAADAVEDKRLGTLGAAVDAEVEFLVHGSAWRLGLDLTVIVSTQSCGSRARPRMRP